MFRGLFFCLLFASIGAPAATGETLTIAVASNFSRPAQAIAERYAAATGHDVRLTPGSTGKLYAQITNGAPFDVFLAADVERPMLLETAGLGVHGSRFTYAIGSLVLWSTDKTLEGVGCMVALEDLADRKLAIANPQTAPYGVAAEQFLKSEGLWDRVQPALVFGENIAQTLQFVASGNASLGLISKSQAIDPRLPAATCRRDVPASQHSDLQQQAILLRRAEHKEAATGFLAFLRDTIAMDIIDAHGYRVPR